MKVPLFEWNISLSTHPRLLGTWGQSAGSAYMTRHSWSREDGNNGNVDALGLEPLSFWTVTQHLNPWPTITSIRFKILKNGPPPTWKHRSTAPDPPSLRMQGTHASRLFSVLPPMNFPWLYEQLQPSRYKEDIHQDTSLNCHPGGRINTPGWLSGYLQTYWWPTSSQKSLPSLHEGFCFMVFLALDLFVLAWECFWRRLQGTSVNHYKVKMSTV